MTARYDIDITTGQPAISRDGERVDVNITTTEHVDVPGFVGVYVDGERQYDTEVSLNGEPRWSVPPRSPRVEALYDQIEAATRRD